MEKSKLGDRSSQYELYELYVDAMYNIGMRFLRIKEDAEDVVQDSFVDAFKNLDQFKPISISIKDERNIDNLIDKIKENLKNKFVSVEDTIITRERHRQHLLQCVYHLDEFTKKEKENDFDKAAEDLRLAVRHLGMIVGIVDVEEILGSIFNDFCIGK